MTGPSLQEAAAVKALRREFSDAVKEALGGFVTCSSEYLSRRDVSNRLSRFILPDPPAVDPLDTLDKVLATGTADEMADWLCENAPAIRAALELAQERGLAIVAQERGE